MPFNLGSLLTTFLFLASMPGVVSSAIDLTQDLPGARDPAGIPRFADSIIIGQRVSESERSSIPTGKWGGNAGRIFWEQSVQVEGPRTRLLYLAPRPAKSLDVIRHYLETLDSQGYQLLFQCSGFDECGKEVAAFYTDAVHGNTFTDSHLLKSVYSGRSVREPQILAARLSQSGTDSYVFVFAAFQDNYADSEAGERVAIFVEQIRAKSTQDGEVLPDAAQLAQKLAQGLAEAGRVVLEGIQFDAGQSTLLPASQPQLDAIARLLHEQPELRVYLVGHTDNAGVLEADLDLSRRRAAEVAQTLARDHRIASERLTPAGIAGLSPLTSNATAAGRARNQRIEMVSRSSPGSSQTTPKRQPSVGTIRP
jgi:outer membrane protein OmpA-like peptidoglycan-associated protein